jgi:glucan phosphorylase
MRRRWRRRTVSQPLSLYPNDQTTCTCLFFIDLSCLTFHVWVVGKELHLKQQYFWTAASLADILRRFKNIDKPITELPDCPFGFLNL